MKTFLVLEFSCLQMTWQMSVKAPEFQLYKTSLGIKRIISVTYRDVESLEISGVSNLKKRSQRFFLTVMSSEYLLQRLCL